MIFGVRQVREHLRSAHAELKGQTKGTLYIHNGKYAATTPPSGIRLGLRLGEV